MAAVAPQFGEDEPVVAPAANTVLSPLRGWLMVSALLLVSLFSFADRKLTFILGESIKQDLMLSDLQLGMLNGMAFLTVYALAAVPLGWLADRGSARNLLIILVGSWSVMTAAGGYAANFIQLALTRAGVAVCEAGGTPASHVLIQRGIERSKRGRAIAIVQMGGGIGTLLGMGLGGWLNTFMSWRTIMIGAGVLGLAVAVAMFAAVPDLRNREGPAKQAPLGPILVRLFRSKAFVWLFVSMTMLGVFSAGTFAFTAPFMIRVHGMTTAEVGILLGVGWFLTGTIGLLLGGWAFDKAQDGAASRIMWAPAAAFIIAGVLAIPGFLLPSALMAVLLISPLSFAGNFHFPATFGTAHLIAGPGSQAIASSVVLLAVSMIGGLIGPLLIGAISDVLMPSLGQDALRWAMLVIPAFSIAAGVALLVANRHVARVLAADLDERRSAAA